VQKRDRNRDRDSVLDVWESEVILFARHKQNEDWPRSHLLSHQPLWHEILQIDGRSKRRSIATRIIENTETLEPDRFVIHSSITFNWSTLPNCTYAYTVYIVLKYFYKFLFGTCTSLYQLLQAENPWKWKDKPARSLFWPVGDINTQLTKPCWAKPVTWLSSKLGWATLSCSPCHSLIHMYHWGHFPV